MSRRFPTSLRLLPAISIAVAGIIFSGGGANADGYELWGVTGDGRRGGVENPETLYRINLRGAEPTLATALGNGTEGEEIAYSSFNGKLLHASGYLKDGIDGLILEWVDPGTLEVTSIPLSGYQYTEVSALVHAGNGFFLASSYAHEFFLISHTGEVTLLGRTDHVPTGFAFIGRTLYSVARDDKLLRKLDPQTGETLSGNTLNGYEDAFRVTALAASPDSRMLYASLAIDNDAILYAAADRLLVRINPETGRIFPVGDLGDSFAGVTFAPDPYDPGTE